MSDRVTVLVIAETLIQAILRDIATFGFLMLMAWFNYKFIGSSVFIYTIILVLFISFSIQVNNSQVFTRKQDAIEFIKKL